MSDPDKRVTYVCETCGSGHVARDAWAQWDVERQEWVIGAAYDYSYCHRCEADAKLEEVELALQSA